MPALPETDRQHCLERGRRPGSIFFVTHRFMPAALQEPLLVLQALLAEIRGIPFAVTDPAVALAKLGWWQQELSGPNRVQSQHPVVRSGVTSGLFERTGAQVLDAYLLAVGQLVRGEPLEDRESLHQVSRDIGGAEVRMMASLERAEIGNHATEAVGGAMMLVNFLEQFPAQLSGGCWWLPMQDQARYSLSLSAVQADPCTKEASKVLRSLSADALSMLQLAGEKLDQAGSAAGRVIPVQLAVLRRRLLRIRSRPLAFQRRGSAGEVWAAWRAATRR
jgi:phytoene synthase